MLITKFDKKTEAMFRDFLLAFVRLRILFHALREPIYGLDFLREMNRQGYHISPGTLYPIFRKLVEEGYLEVYQQVVAGKVRKYYRTTWKGEQTLRETYAKARKLWEEIRELESHFRSER